MPDVFIFRNASTLIALINRPFLLISSKSSDQDAPNYQIKDRSFLIIIPNEQQPTNTAVHFGNISPRVA